MEKIQANLNGLSIVADLMDEWTRLENSGYINRHQLDREEIQILTQQLRRCQHGLEMARYQQGIAQRELRSLRYNFETYVEAYQQLWRFIDEIMREQPELRDRYANRLLPMAMDEVLSDSDHDTNTQRTLVFESDDDTEPNNDVEIIDLTNDD